MTDTLLFIPPCCVDKKLPQAIMQAPRRSLTFYTHGDVTMEKFYRAVAYLVQDPHVMVLTMPTITNSTVVFLLQCFERGWITDLVLSSSRDITNILKTYLGDYTSHIIYTFSKDVTDFSSHLVLYNDRQSLHISGPMLESCFDARLLSYHMLFQPRYDAITQADYGNPLTNILIPDILRHRQAKHPIPQKSYNIDRFLSLHLPPTNL